MYNHECLHQTLRDHVAFEVRCNGLEGRGGELLSVSEPRRERVFAEHRSYTAIVDIVGVVMMKLGIIYSY